jgi:polyferredoxin
MSLQLIPAFLSLNVLIISILIVISLLFGRIYCSTLCPLGVLQDIVAWKSRFFRKKKKKFRFQYVAPQNLMRYSILALTIIVFIAGSSFLVILLDPYSIFGRFVSQLFRPLIIWGNNGLAAVLSSLGNYTLYKVEQTGFVPVAFGISLFFFLLVATMSWFRGRLFCNTICPAGTFLGLLSRYSLFKISIEESSCTSCGLCAKHCKSQCINSAEKTVDDSRCVTCFNCISTCKTSGVKYGFRYNKKVVQPTETVQKSSQNSRRTFLLTSGAIVTSLAVANAKTLTGKRDAILSRKPIMPPGANNLNHFNAHCTGCQLCVTKCPMEVLKPAALQYGISGIMQPHLAFSTHVFCTYDCNICSSVCPTGALKPLPMEEKKLAQIGIAKLRIDMCVVTTDETDCGACSEHCPTQAVHMIPYKNVLTTQPRLLLRHRDNPAAYNNT